jgi:hypothetical protein
MGSVYKKRRKQADGSVREEKTFWAKWYQNGRAMRESTGCEKETDARRFLKVREGAVASGAPVLPRTDRIQYAEVAADLRRHYEATGSRDLAEYDRRVAHIARFFGGRRIAGLGQSDVDAYVLRRLGEGVVGSTIRRELGTLTTMLRRAYRNGKLHRLPSGQPEGRAGARRILRAGPVRGRPPAAARGPQGGGDDRVHLRLAHAERGPSARTAAARSRGRDAAPGSRQHEE